MIILIQALCKSVHGMEHSKFQRIMILEIKSLSPKLKHYAGNQILMDSLLLHGPTLNPGTAWICYFIEWSTTLECQLNPQFGGKERETNMRDDMLFAG